MQQNHGAFRLPGLVVLRTQGMGLGVFAGKKIRKGTLIERCPVLPLSRSGERKVQSMSLRDYSFAWGERPCLSCIVLGWGSIYNHSDQPNAMYKQFKRRNQMEFMALRDIQKGEQIFIDYDWDPDEYVLCGIRRAAKGPTRKTGSRKHKKSKLRKTNR